MMTAASLLSSCRNLERCYTAENPVTNNYTKCVVANSSSANWWVVYSLKRCKVTHSSTRRESLRRRIAISHVESALNAASALQIDQYFISNHDEILWWQQNLPAVTAGMARSQVPGC